MKDQYIQAIGRIERPVNGIFKRKVTRKGSIYQIEGKTNDILVHRDTLLSPHLQRFLKVVDKHGEATLPLTAQDVHELWLHRANKMEGGKWLFTFGGKLFANAEENGTVFELDIIREGDTLGIDLWIVKKTMAEVLEEVCFYYNDSLEANLFNDEYKSKI